MIKTILFDLDGTIINTNELIIASFLHALEGVTPEPCTRELVISHFGKSLVEQLRFFSGMEEIEDLIEKYRSFNISKHDELVAEFPYVTPVLEKLHRHGVSLGVVTNKMRVTTMMGLNRFGLNPFLKTVVTVEDVSRPKPHPDGILKASADLEAEAASTLMVGDSQFDILSAKQAGVRSAGVAWTLKGEAFLRQYEPDYILQDIRDLLDICGIKRDEA